MTQTQNLVDTLILFGKQKGIISLSSEQYYRGLAQKNLDLAIQLVARANWSLNDWRRKDPERLSLMKQQFPGEFEKLMKTLSSPTVLEDRSKWTLDDWRRKDPRGLENMRDKEPAKYKKLIEKINPKEYKTDKPREKWDFEDYRKYDPDLLESIMANDPEEFDRLLKTLPLR